MTKDQQFNTMLRTLKKICSEHESLDKLKKYAKSTYGLTYTEMLERTYQSIRTDARYILQHIKPLNTNDQNL